LASGIEQGISMAYGNSKRKWGGLFSYGSADVTLPKGRSLPLIGAQRKEGGGINDGVRWVTEKTENRCSKGANRKSLLRRCGLTAEKKLESNSLQNPGKGEGKGKRNRKDCRKHELSLVE